MYMCVSGTPTWLCYRSSSTGPITTTVRSNPGTSSTITASTASGSGNGVWCVPLARRSYGSSVSLTWVEPHKNIYEQGLDYKRRYLQQNDNDHVHIGLPVSVSLGPKINPGGNITATYTNRVQGRPTWLCYKSGNSAIGTSPGCGNPGTSYTITSSGSTSTTVQCTANETSASSIDLTLVPIIRNQIYVRACTSSGDSLQYDNPMFNLEYPRLVLP